MLSFLNAAMMDSRLLLLSVFFSQFLSSNCDWYDSNRQRLNAFKKSFKNSESDIIIFIDVSGSVRSHGFRTEKYFVTSLLNEFSVAFYSTRVAVITFGERVKTDLNYINLESKDSEDTTKCEFKKTFEYRVTFRNGRATNMKSAFRSANDLLKEAQELGWKRRNVNTVAMMITDGAWNLGDPSGEIYELKNGDFNVDIFSVGVGYADRSQLQTIASRHDKVIYANNFNQFKELAKYIRGGRWLEKFCELSNLSNCTRSQKFCTQLSCMKHLTSQIVEKSYRNLAAYCTMQK